MSKLLSKEELEAHWNAIFDDLGLPSSVPCCPSCQRVAAIRAHIEAQDEEIKAMNEWQNIAVDEMRRKDEEIARAHGRIADRGMEIARLLDRLADKEGRIEKLAYALSCYADDGGHVAINALAADAKAAKEQG